MTHRVHTSIFHSCPPESREGHLQEAAWIDSQSSTSLLYSLPFRERASSWSLRLTVPPCPGAVGRQSQLVGIWDRGSGIRHLASGIRDPGSGIQPLAPQPACGGSSCQRLSGGRGSRAGGAGRAGPVVEGGAWVGLQPLSRLFSPHPPPLVRSPAPAPPSGLGGGVRRQRRREDQGGAGRGAAPRAGLGGLALAAGAAPWAPQSGRSPRLGPPILLRRGECAGRPPGCVCISLCPGLGSGPSGCVSVRASVGGGTNAFQNL